MTGCYVKGPRLESPLVIFFVPSVISLANRESSLVNFSASKEPLVNQPNGRLH